MEVSKGVLKKATVEQGLCFDKHGRSICLVLLQNLLQNYMIIAQIFLKINVIKIVSPTRQNFLPKASFLVGCESLHTGP